MLMFNDIRMLHGSMEGAGYEEKETHWRAARRAWSQKSQGGTSIRGMPGGGITGTGFLGIRMQFIEDTKNLIALLYGVVANKR